MRTKEDILDKLIGDTGEYPHYEMNQFQKNTAYDAMSEFAKEQAISFAEWKIANRWFTYENGYWYYTFEQGTSMSDAAYNKHYRKTTDQLYAQFIESQSSHQQ